MDLSENFNDIHDRIRSACQRSGRDPESVTLVAISKGQLPEAIIAAAETGQTLFGENKVQEAKVKIGQCPGRLRWHMTGHLQSNKCRDAVHFFEMVQSVDSLSLAQELDKCANKAAKTMPILLEVNVAGEASKFGYQADQLLADLNELNALPRIEIHGLMTIAPYSPEPEKARPYFHQMAELKTRCEEILEVPLEHLSMGMSGDFEVAIEEGATMVRIGTSIPGWCESSIWISSHWRHSRKRANPTRAIRS